MGKEFDDIQEIAKGIELWIGMVNTRLDELNESFKFMISKDEVAIQILQIKQLLEFIQRDLVFLKTIEKGTK
jgi:hypothetical protein